MRAARIHGWNTVPVIEDVPEPVRRPGQTLVRVDAATVSHLDLTVRTGAFALTPPLPYVPGCEGAGTVVESEAFAPGTQVIVSGGALGLDRDGTWRERIVLPDGMLMAIKTPLPPSIAAAFFTPTTTAAVTLFDIGGLESGQTVLITGATGAVGALAVQLARAAGAHVVAVVSRASRLAALPTDVVGVAMDDVEATARLAAERPADLLVDTIGGPGLGERIGWVRFGGRAACLGYSAGTRATLDLPNWFFSSVAILPVNLMAYGKQARTHARRLLPRFADGSLTIPVEEFPLVYAADAIMRLEGGRLSGRAVLRFPSPDNRSTA